MINDIEQWHLQMQESDKLKRKCDQQLRRMNLSLVSMLIAVPFVLFGIYVESLLLISVAIGIEIIAAFLVFYFGLRAVKFGRASNDVLMS